MFNVLHITTHMGGGIGNVLSSTAIYSKNNNTKYQHKILLLEKPEKEHFIQLARKHKIDVIIAEDMNTVEQLMLQADIVELSYTHHPKMVEFLVNFPKIPIRFILWSHISGCNYPELAFEFAKKFHRCFFTSPYSYESPYWNDEQKKYIYQNSTVIYGVGDIRQVDRVVPTEHDTFNIGYIGTLNYSKIHPEFIDYCSQIDIPNVKFILVGDNENQKLFEQEGSKKGILEKLHFTGYTKNVNKELACFDVFGYPLNPYHFGTTENAILEAMAAGLPVVALNQCTERYLIQHMQTGLLANNKQEYGELIRYLYEHPEERIRIGQNAREYVLKEFAIDKNVNNMERCYDDVMDMPAQIFEFKSVFGEEPYEWFLACLGKERSLFEKSLNKNCLFNDQEMKAIKEDIKNCSYILREKSKSSINHFSRYYDDKNILMWKEWIKS